MKTAKAIKIPHIVWYPLLDSDAEHLACHQISFILSDTKLTIISDFFEKTRMQIKCVVCKLPSATSMLRQNLMPNF